MTNRNLFPYAILITIACILFENSYAASNHAQPFFLSNQNPMIQIYGLPRTEPTTLIDNGDLQGLLAIDIVNNTVQGETSNEKFILDGETNRYNFMLRYGFSNTFEIDLTMPYIKHSSGRFDNFIQNWHDFLGLSNEEQKQFTPNNLNYYYSYRGKELVNITDDTGGIGDIKIGLSFDLIPLSDERESIIRLGMKLPTGSSDRLLGSGAVDYSLTIAARDDVWGREKFISLYGQAGVLLTGRSDLFPDIQRRFVMHGSAGFDWSYWDSVVLRTQLDMHSSMYKSDIAHLGESSVQLTLGGTIKFAGGENIDIGVSENLMTDSTPDVGLNLVFRSKIY